MKMSNNWAIAALAATALTVGTTPLEAYPIAARAMQPASATSPDTAELQRGGRGGARGGGQSAGTRSGGGGQARAAGGGAQARPTRQAGTAHNVRSTSGSSINSANRSANRNTNRNVNRNTNINRDVNVDVDGGWGGGGYGYGYGYHPIAAGVAIGATAAVVGSIVNSPPSSGCVTQIVNGISYTQCGSTWYQPQYAGSDVEYIVVNQPY